MIRIGDWVRDPRQPVRARRGRVVAVRENPACLMRSLSIRWLADGDRPEEVEELDEIEFGPLKD